MDKSAQREIDALFDRAEAAGTCLVAPSAPIAQRLRRRVARGDVVSPRRGVFARASRWRELDPGERDLHVMRALGAKHPDWVFCGPSAALAHGLWVPWQLCGTIRIARPCDERGGQRRVAGIRWVRGRVGERAIAAGLLVTSLDETVVSCLREARFVDGLGIADSWARMTRLGSADLLARVDRLGARRRGAPGARLTASCCDGRAENGGESYARAVMLLLGYAAPQLQVRIPDPLDRWRTNRVDFLWETAGGGRVVGELDGLVKYVDPAHMGGLGSEQVRARERLRESRLAVPGVSVMRFSMGDVSDRRRFSRLLECYGVPRATGAAAVLARRLRAPRTACRRQGRVRASTMACVKARPRSSGDASGPSGAAGPIDETLEATNPASRSHASSASRVGAARKTLPSA